MRSKVALLMLILSSDVEYILAVVFFSLCRDFSSPLNEKDGLQLQKPIMARPCKIMPRVVPFLHLLDSFVKFSLKFLLDRTRQLIITGTTSVSCGNQIT